ncbi:hypothetical protein C8J57DRAFT_1479622 [Mycena rebaudengoi]|nr:hypothetical protein C8J57DRAFT_1479622 [Mycena rebaudengoi]
MWYTCVPQLGHVLILLGYRPRAIETKPTPANDHRLMTAYILRCSRILPPQAPATETPPSPICRIFQRAAAVIIILIVILTISQSHQQRHQQPNAQQRLQPSECGTGTVERILRFGDAYGGGVMIVRGRAGELGCGEHRARGRRLWGGRMVTETPEPFSRMVWR